MSLFLPASGPLSVLREEHGVPFASSLGLWVDGTLRGRNEKSRERQLSRKGHAHVKPGIGAAGVENGDAPLYWFLDCVLHNL